MPLHLACMKRANVVLNEELLDEALKITGERTYSAVLNRGLAELVRLAKLKRGIQSMRDTPDVFLPHYLEELRPNSWAAYENRRAAYEGRPPRKAKGRGRSPR